jgi:hypothetical protein
MAQTVNKLSKISVGEIYILKIASTYSFLLSLLSLSSGLGSVEFDYKTATMWQILALNLIAITAILLVILIIYAWFLA